MDSVTHLAGPVVGFRNGRRVIQRCAVCGAKLIDSLRASVVLRSDGASDRFPTWGEGRLVNVDGNRSIDAGSFLDVEELPDDFCLALVEE